MLASNQTRLLLQRPAAVLVMQGRRSLATAITASSATTTPWQRFRQFSQRFHRLGMFLRYSRIPFLVVSVYSVGYQQGVIDCTRTPLALQESMLKGLLRSTGVTSSSQVHTVKESEISWTSRQRHHQVARVGHQIISAARQHVQDELQSAMDALKERLPPDVPHTVFLQACETDEHVQFWYDARMRLQGEDVRNKVWEYLFLESPTPNAFVTEILPHRFFITTAMLNVATTPDELAMVLGHETAHLILGHVSQTNQVETMLRTLEILLLTLDPTEGVLSVMVVGGLAYIHRALAAKHSRVNEQEADDLGQLLAAKACFDTTQGAHVMYKMHQMAIAPASQKLQRDAASSTTTHNTVIKVVPQLLDTHPPSLDRWERLKEKSKTENWQQYSHCAGVTTRFLNAIWGPASSQDSPTPASKDSETSQQQ